MKVNTKNLSVLASAVLMVGVILMSGCVRQQTGQVGIPDITGAWHGTYQSSRGNGEWSWVIEKSGNGYTGILTTTGPYSGQNIPVTVALSGNKITVGWVAAGVTFEGTVSGDRMSGTWRFQNGMDSGTWEGVRGKSSITPSGAPSGPSGGTGTTEETQQDPYEAAQETQPIGDTAKKLDAFIKPKLVTVFGGAKLVSSGTFTGNELPGGEAVQLGYIVKRKIQVDDVNTLKSLIEKEGYTAMTSGVTSEEFTIIFMKQYKPTLLIVGDIGSQGIEVAGVIEK